MKYPILRPNKYTSLGIGLLLLVILLSIVFSMFFSSFSVEGFNPKNCTYGSKKFNNNPDCYYHVVHNMYDKYVGLRSKINNKKARPSEINEFFDVKDILDGLYLNSTGDNKIKHQEVLNDYIITKK